MRLESRVFSSVLSFAIATVLSMNVIGVQAARSDCVTSDRLTGGCPVVGASNNGDSVGISATMPGSEGGSADSSSGAGTGADDFASGSGSADDTPENNGSPTSDEGAASGDVTEGLPDNMILKRDEFVASCVPLSPCDTEHFSVGVSDLVNFAPVPPSVSLEPNGWAIVGLPANFIAMAPGATRTGMLLGYEAQVRFTPIGYRWDYGDGATRSTGDPGHSWAALGVPEFSTTGTSHTYRSKGTYGIRLSVSYHAEYHYIGLGWRSVDGTVTATSRAVSLVAGEARTVLVNEDCGVDPRGPGC